MPALIEGEQGVPGIPQRLSYVRIATSVFAETVDQAYDSFWLWPAVPIH